MQIAIVGAGGFAREVASYLSCEFSYFVDDENANLEKGIFPLSQLDTKRYKVLVAIGSSKQRADVITRIPKGAKFFTFIHDTAVVGPDVELGEGTIVCPGVVLTTSIKIGCHAHLNLHSTVGHDCVIGDYFTTAPGTKISGNCKINDHVYFGTNSCTRQGVEVTSDVIVGLNAGVVSNINLPGTYVGTPAKKIK